MAAANDSLGDLRTWTHHINIKEGDVLGDQKQDSSARYWMTSIRQKWASRKWAGKTTGDSRNKARGRFLLRWIFATLYSTQRFITAWTRAQLWSVSSAIWIHPSSKYSIYLFHFNIIISTTPWYSKQSLSFNHFSSSNFCVFHFLLSSK